jgi:hypothetical protein
LTDGSHLPPVWVGLFPQGKSPGRHKKGVYYYFLSLPLPLALVTLHRQAYRRLQCIRRVTSTCSFLPLSEAASLFVLIGGWIATVVPEKDLSRNLLFPIKDLSQTILFLRDLSALYLVKMKSKK